MERFLSSALDSGSVRPVVDRVFPLEDAVSAYDHMRSGTQFGKIVVATGLADL